MSNLAQYTFIPWFRQGLAVKINEKDSYAALGQDGSVDERVHLEIELFLEDTTISDKSISENIIRKDVAIYGPGDIRGIDNRAIIRTEPKAGINNYEANNLAYIEFYEEDFPWRYTPANPDDSNQTIAKRLRPWLTLVVLKDDEHTLNTQGEQGLSSITITQATIDISFPEPSEIWAWAHVQINRELSHTNGTPLVNDVTNELENNPDIGISRLICPRKLQKKTQYTAFLIPSFETGRLIGIDNKTTGIKVQQPAWRLTASGGAPAPDTNIEFPFYFHWRFHTGEYGDFESLVSILKPIITDPENGKMPMDIQSPGYALDGMADTPTLGFEGALKPPNFKSDPFQELQGNADFIEQLRKTLNLSTDLAEDQNNTDNTALDLDHPFYNAADNAVDDPIITPPTYGIWHALIPKLPVASDINKSWINELNLDPRYRGGAGLGTTTVQKNQEKLMDEAWKQVGEINKANEKIRQAELAKMVSGRIYKKHITRGSNDRLLSITNPMHNRVLSSDATRTVNQDFRNSRIPLVAKSAAFRRIVRPNRKLNRKINHQASTKTAIHQQLLSNFNRDEAKNDAITAAKLKILPINTLSIKETADAIEEQQQNYNIDSNFLARDAFVEFFLTRSDNTIANRNAWIAAINADSSLASDVRVLLIELVNAITAFQLQPDGDLKITLEQLTYEKFYGTGSSAKRYQILLIQKKDEVDIQHVGPITTQAEIQQFQTDFNLLQSVVTGMKTPTHLPVLSNFNLIKKDLRQKLHPALTISKRVISQIKVWNGVAMQAIEELKPVMAYPEFKDPVYEHLKKISQDFILPNVEKLPQDSITILQTNQRFIESYMVGLNHEMARELLWREFPTDQRGSCFRQFWDIRDNLFENDPEKQFDIKKMHEWRNSLGNNRARTWNENDPEDDGNIVLVVRGQLLLKYPNTMVFAQKAAYDINDPKEQRVLAPDSDAANIKYPLFSAQLEPDIFLFGFDFSIDQARGVRIRNNSDNPVTSNPGWFFVFKERPGQIKFGLDDYADEMGDTSGLPPTSNPNEWNDLTWEHLVDNKADLSTYCITFDKTLLPTSPPFGEPVPKWGNNAADLASILYQNPVIFARHAGEMLPKEEED